MLERKERVDYGQDAPALVRNCLRFGAFGVALGGLLAFASARKENTLQRLLFPVGVLTTWAGSGLLTRASVIIFNSRYIKIQAAKRVLDDLHLRGDETILDVGCGRGLMLIEAAKRLPRGRAFGVDRRVQRDQADNTRDATLENARIAGVSDRVEVYDGDMRNLNFLSDKSVDVVLANLAIHNIYEPEGRRQAFDEIIRVLKPGGRVALMDMFLVDEFAQILRERGMLDVQISQPVPFGIPPFKLVSAQKSAL